MTWPTDREAKEEIIRVGRLLYEEGLNTGTDGNISCRVDGGEHLWTTCSGSAKGFLTEQDLVKTDLDGNILEGEAKPSSELKLHLCVYRHNALAQAAVHAHTVAATALACAGVGLTEPLAAPVPLQLGKVHVAPYAMTGRRWQTASCPMWRTTMRCCWPITGPSPGAKISGRPSPAWKRWSAAPRSISRSVPWARPNISRHSRSRISMTMVCVWGILKSKEIKKRRHGCFTSMPPSFIPGKYF